jgi:glycosyltransferase involved in cell wall biosynthesis
MTDKRIAIFQADWPIQTQTVNCAILFARRGYEVDLFLHRTVNYVELELLTQYASIHIYDCVSNNDRHDETSRKLVENNKRITKKIYDSLVRYMPVLTRLRGVLTGACEAYRMILGKEDGLLPNWIVRQALDRMGDRSYRYLIGIEKKGLIWAGHVAEQIHVPFIYYSMELYTNDYQRRFMKLSLSFVRLRQAEQRQHRKAMATIIQDRERAHVLFQDNALELSSSRVWYVPVSLMNGPSQERSTMLHHRCQISHEQRIVLYYGLIAERRYAYELTRVAQIFPDDWMLVFHGWGAPSTVEHIKAIDHRKKVCLSLNMVPSGELHQIVSSADIGLVFYSPELQNERLTVFASEKIAFYLKCGVPIIAFNYPGYRRLTLDEQCGTVVDKIDELPSAIQRCLESHETFSRNARTAYSKYYRYENHFNPVIDELERLATVSSNGRARDRIRRMDEIDDKDLERR